MIYQLPSGKIIELSLEQYLDMTDEDIEYFIAYNIGNEIENPFFNASLNNKETIILESSDEIEEETLDLLEITVIDKLIDLDVDKSMLEE